jgi:hypothetical protein
MRTPVGGIELSVVEVVGQRLVEQEGTARSVVGDGLGIDGTLPHAMHASRGDPGSKLEVWSSRKSR